MGIFKHLPIWVKYLLVCVLDRVFPRTHEVSPRVLLSQSLQVLSIITATIVFAPCSESLFASALTLQKSGNGPAASSLSSAALADATLHLGEATAATLELEWVRELPGRGVVLAWTQTLGGVPVRESVGRMWMVQADDGRWFCQYRAFVGVEWQAAHSESDLYSANLLDPDADFPERKWSVPKLEYLRGEDKHAELAWVFYGSSLDESLHSTLRVDYSALSGQRIAVEEVVCSLDVSGSIFAERTSGTGPQGSAGTSIQSISGVRLTGGGATTHANMNGDYSLSSSQNSFTVMAELEGQWGGVSSQIASAMTVSEQASGPNLDLVFNGGGDPNLIAQLNAFHYVDQGYRLFMESAGGFPAMSSPVNATTGMSGTCNAYYDPSQQLLRFLRAGGGCVDSAYSSVVLHEFGHHVVNSLNLSQGAFGEGYGDALAIVYLQDGIIGRDFAGSGNHVRNVSGSSVTVPCGSSIHFCGQALGKFWFNLGNNLRTDLGATVGQQVLEQLFVDWSALTMGGINGYPIRDEMILEVLTADDDDGDLNNGSPHWNQICAAADAGGLACPDLATLILTLIEGPADLMPPQVDNPVVVNWQTISSTPAAGESEIRYREEGSSIWNSTPLQAAPNSRLEGVIPPQTCLTSLEWYIRVPDQGGFVTQYPALGPNQPLSTLVATSTALAQEESLGTDPGWSTSLPSDTALVGRWEWGVPVGTAAQPSSGVPSTNGDSAGYFTGLGEPGGSLGAEDIDFGDTTLTTDAFALDPVVRQEISYWRWFCNNASASTPDDFLTVSKSLDGGSTWEVIEEIGPGHPQAGGGWFQNSFTVEPGSSSTDSVRLRFHTGDLGGGSIVEAGVDLVEVRVLECDNTGPPPPPVNSDYIPSDCNADGSNDLSDAVQLLEVLFGAATNFVCQDACDSDDNGRVDVGDAILMLSSLFGGGGVPVGGPCGPDLTFDALDCQLFSVCP